MFAIALPFLGGIGAPELIILCGCCSLPIFAVVLVVGLSGRKRRNAAQIQAPAAPAGWLPDPAGRHQLRYWDGAAWSPSVSDNGVQSVDPV